MSAPSGRDASPQEELAHWMAGDRAVPMPAEQPTPAAVPAAAAPAAAPLMEDRSQDGLRARLGLRPTAWALAASLRINGWIVTVIVTVLAAITRFVGLSHPRGLMFDEIYYVKEGYALWHVGYEAEWKEGADSLFATGDVAHALTTKPEYVVHPELGKWLIGSGMEIFGVNSFGWRFMPALAGVLTVLLVTRIMMRLVHSPLLAGLAGFFLAIDGIGITESRIALLDNFIGLFASCALYCLVRDRQWMRERLARGLADRPAGSAAPLLLWRPWLLATAISLGLTCSIKWSGLYLLAAVGVMVVVWDVCALRAVGARSWHTAGFLGRGLQDFLYLVPTALVVYVAGWFSWFAHSKAFNHEWAAQRRATGQTLPRSWMPDSLNSLLDYHIQMYRFHVGLDSTHPYMSKPISWLAQTRPTLFYYPAKEDLGSSCGSSHCVEAISAIGNIPVWWFGIGALAVVITVAVARRDWRMWVPLIGYVGLYLPWFQYPDRTIFSFYTVAFVPCVVMVLALALGSLSGMIPPPPGSAAARDEERAVIAGATGPGLPAPRGIVARFLGFGRWRGLVSPRFLTREWIGVAGWRLRYEGLVATGVVVALAVIFGLLWWPLWTGQRISYDFWYWHMWFQSWI